MLGAKIWGLAQLLNAIICLACFGELAIFIVPISLIGGLPALSLYVLWIMILQEYISSGWIRVLSCIVIFSSCTSLCALGVAFLAINSLNGMLPYMLPSVIATLASTLLLSRRILLLQSEEEEKANNPESI